MSEQKSYPRSMPFQPPDSIVPSPPTVPPPFAPPVPQRQPIALVVYALLFVAGVGLGSVLLNKFTPRSAADTGSKPAADQSSGKKTTDTPPADKDSRPVRPDSPPARLPQKGGVAHPLGQVPQEAPSVPKTAAVGQIPEAVVEALGGLTAAHLYQTYLNIGLLADAVEKDVYEVVEAKKMLATVAGLTAAVEQQLGEVAKLALKEDEKKMAEQAQQITVLLSTQARELRAYWDTGEAEHTLKFHKARREAWTNIKSLLNIKE